MTVPRSAPKIVDLAEMDAAFGQTLRFSRITIGGIGTPAAINLGNRDADCVALFLKDAAAIDIEFGRNSVRQGSARAYDCSMHDLRPAQEWKAENGLDVAMFEISTAALERWTRENGVRSVGGLRFENGVLHPDEVIKGFGLALLPYLDDPDEAPRLFVDYVLSAVCMHLVRTYGAPRSEARGIGGLAPWQERRAKEQIDASLDAQISLKALADGCGLSVSHFARAFRATVGMPPHQWLLQRRIERSIELLKEGRLAIVQIAAACGFSDQSHFTRAFAKSVGEAPGAWRRAQSHRWPTSRPDLYSAPAMAAA